MSDEKEGKIGIGLGELALLNRRDRNEQIYKFWLAARELASEDPYTQPSEFAFIDDRIKTGKGILDITDKLENELETELEKLIKEGK